MIFAHDTEVSLGAVAALVNTMPDAGYGAEEGLPDQAALDAFLERWRWSGHRRRDEAELRAVQELRPRLAEFWTADEDRAVEITNALLREANALPQLVRHDEWVDYHLHATSPEAPLSDRMATEAAMAMVDVIRMQELDRLRECASDTCGSVLVDLSKNRSRRYCEKGCGNRANVAAYRARLRSNSD